MSENLIGDHIPLDHIAEAVIETGAGGVLAMFEVAGVFPDTADGTDTENWSAVWEGALLNIAADDVEIISYQCRGEADPRQYEDAVHSSGFAGELAAAYKANLFARSLYSNRLFLAVHIHAPNAAARGLTKFFADASDPRAGLDERVGRLNDICDLLQAQLSIYGLRRLGYVERGHVGFSEIAEAIVLAMTGRYRPIALTTGRLGHSMFSEEIKFRRKRIEFHGPGDTVFAEMYAFKEYPAVTWSGMFSSLAVASYRSTLMQSFRFLSNAAAVTVVGRKQNKMVSANDKALSQIASLTEAADDLMSRKWVLGNHSLVLTVFADSPQAMSEVGNAAWRDLAACGLTACRITHALQAAFLSLLPNGEAWRPRPGFVKSRNFVAFAPLYNWPAGALRGHWPGPPIAIFRTLAGTPFGFFWHPPMSDLGNTLITGAPGAGKTLLTGALLTLTAGRARIIALDHKQGWRFLLRELRGDYAVLGDGRPNFAPLKALDGSPRNMAFLIELLRGCIGGRMTEEEGRRLSIGLSAIMTLPPADRSLGELRAFFTDEPEGAGARLEKWIAGNELGWVIDAPVDTVRFGALSGLDVTALLENERARGVAMGYLMHRIADCLDGSPCLIPIDEGWRALIDPTFRGLIEKQLRTIRSKNGAVVFITQSPSDIVESGINRVLREMCQTHFALPNPRGQKSDYVQGMGLTEGQWEALRPLQGGQGMFLLIQGNSSVVAQLPMAGPGMERFVRILSAREADLRLELAA